MIKDYANKVMDYEYNASGCRSDSYHCIDGGGFCGKCGNGKGSGNEQPLIQTL